LNYLKGAESSLKQEIANNTPFLTTSNGKYWAFIEQLKTTSSSLVTLMEKPNSPTTAIQPILDMLNNLKDVKCKNERNYNKPFEYGDIDSFHTCLVETIKSLGGTIEESLPVNEDVPIRFSDSDLLSDLDFLATNSNNRQWFDFFLVRVRTMLSDARMHMVVNDDPEISLADWLSAYIGSDPNESGCISVLDLSLVPSDVVHVITAVVARMVFESLQRYKSMNGATLPTVLVMEEAHTFVKRYKSEDGNENHDATTVCCQVFEKIAREGRKFGLGLVLSSQRPSELSPTVLSQCNTFLLHRISNDRDQELVNRLVPDNLKGLLRELPSLPSQSAILLGWATELPVLVKMNDLPKHQQPQSDDPDFWNVWTAEDDKSGEPVLRPAEWKPIADEWQGKSTPPEGVEPAL
jgi:hypothetical protein